jgi:SnoaL-like domain
MAANQTGVDRIATDRIATDRIAIAKALFAGWSSGNADAPEQFFHPHATLYDVASGTFVGWPAIRTFFASGLERWDDLLLAPDQFWVNDDGLALHYVMSATITDPVTFGEQFVGVRWQVDVMSELRFEGDRIVYEADYHDRGARARYLATL